MDDQFSDSQTASKISPSPAELPPPPRPTPPRPSLSEMMVGRLQQLGVSLLLLAVVWVVALIVLFLVGLQTRDALGFATVISLIASFFLRTLIPGLAAKVQPTPEAAAQPTDSAREIVETVVFVVVLVLLLKSFTAEAFVIPTGSMAETLRGYHKSVQCPQCKLEFPVNCSNEAEPPDGADPAYVTGCTCPNCQQQIPLRAGRDIKPDPPWDNGDRVLVAKFVYDLFDHLPDRLDVVVFKFPGDEFNSNFPASGPIKKNVPINYIKRLIGRPGETIAIHRGKIFVLSPENGVEEGLVYNDVAEAGNDPSLKMQLWRLPKTHHNDPKAVEAFKQGRFEIIRKKPGNLLSMRRIVYDNDHQAMDLTAPEYQRWRPGDKTGWSPSGKTAFSHEGTGDGKDFEWVHYNHILRDAPGQPQLITDFMGYNTGTSDPQNTGNWASDLMVECQVDVADAKGTVALEISRGPDRYQALFDFATGTCSLYQCQYDEDGRLKGPAKEVKSALTSLKKGSHHLRFANIDDRLIVWVDEGLVFGEGVNLPSPSGLVPTERNDLKRPASIGSRGAKVTVSKIKVYRDTYYTTAKDNPKALDLTGFKPDDPKNWPDLATVEPSTYYVQPGHFLCMGDNSPFSSDGRSWGLVPQRLLLGRALLVYWPFSRAGRIR